MTFSVRQALIDSGLFTPDGTRSIVANVRQPERDPGEVRVVLTFDMFGDLADVRATPPITSADVEAAEKQARAEVYQDCIDAFESALARAKDRR